MFTVISSKEHNINDGSVRRDDSGCTSLRTQVGSGIRIENGESAANWNPCWPALLRLCVAQRTQRVDPTDFFCSVGKNEIIHHPGSQSLSILIVSGCYNKISQPGGLNNRHWFSQLWGLESQFSSWEGRSPRLAGAAFSLSSEGVVVRHLHLWSSFHKDTDRIAGPWGPHPMTSSMPNHHPKATPRTIAWGTGALTREFGGRWGRHRQLPFLYICQGTV